TDQRGVTRPQNDPVIPAAIGGDNSDIGAFEVEVHNTPPAIACPPSTTSDCAPASGLPVTFAALNFLPGVHPLTIEVRDGFATASCDTTVTVNADTQAPVVTCPANQSVNATSPAGATVNYPAANASDDCGVASISYSKNSGTLFAIGDTLVTVTVLDAAN